MYYTKQDYAEANAQFWNLCVSIRTLERESPGHPDIASLYEDAEFLQTTAITWRIRTRCADMVAEYRRRTGAASSTPVASGAAGATAPAQPSGDREPA